MGTGLIIAFIGGIVEYFVSLRPSAQESPRRLPGCLLYAAGGLGFAGLIAIIASLIVNKGVGDALILGAGVLSGFYAGFLFLFILWFLFNR